MIIIIEVHRKFAVVFLEIYIFLLVFLLLVSMFHLFLQASSICLDHHKYSLKCSCHNLLCSFISNQAIFSICRFLDLPFWCSYHKSGADFFVLPRSFCPYLMLWFLHMLFFCRGWKSLAFNINSIFRFDWILHYIPFLNLLCLLSLAAQILLIKTLNEIFLSEYDLLMKHFVPEQMTYFEQMYYNELILILTVILFWILLIYIWTIGLSAVSALCFLLRYLK